MLFAGILCICAGKKPSIVPLNADHALNNITHVEPLELRTYNNRINSDLLPQAGYAGRYPDLGVAF